MPLLRQPSRCLSLGTVRVALPTSYWPGLSELFANSTSFSGVRRSVSVTSILSTPPQETIPRATGSRANGNWIGFSAAQRSIPQTCKGLGRLAHFVKASDLRHGSGYSRDRDDGCRFWLRKFCGHCLTLLADALAIDAKPLIVGQNQARRGHGCRVTFDSVHHNLPCRCLGAVDPTLRW